MISSSRETSHRKSRNTAQNRLSEIRQRENPDSSSVNFVEGMAAAIRRARQQPDHIQALLSACSEQRLVSSFRVPVTRPSAAKVTQKESVITEIKKATLNRPPFSLIYFILIQIDHKTLLQHRIGNQSPSFTSTCDVLPSVTVTVVTPAGLAFSLQVTSSYVPAGTSLMVNAPSALLTAE
jgi:hypothetical protein